jgi:hypothetical protein
MPVTIALFTRDLRVHDTRCCTQRCAQALVPSRCLCSMIESWVLVPSRRTGPGFSPTPSST